MDTNRGDNLAHYWFFPSYVRFFVIWWKLSLALFLHNLCLLITCSRTMQMSLTWSRILASYPMLTAEKITCTSEKTVAILASSTQIPNPSCTVSVSQTNLPLFLGISQWTQKSLLMCSMLLEMSMKWMEIMEVLQENSPTKSQESQLWIRILVSHSNTLRLWLGLEIRYILNLSKIFNKKTPQKSYSEFFFFIN